MVCNDAIVNMPDNNFENEIKSNRQEQTRRGILGVLVKQKLEKIKREFKEKEVGREMEMERGDWSRNWMGIKRNFNKV